MYYLCIVCKILKDRESVHFVHHCVLSVQTSAWPIVRTHVTFKE